MTRHYMEIDECEVCGNRELTSVLDLGAHPMCDDLIQVGDTRKCREYPIEILYCNVCRTAHQRFQVPKNELFPKSYHYRSRFTADVLNGMKALVESCRDRFGPLAGRKVLDIGCNDGSLLDFFSAEGAVTIGIEPTGAAADAMGRGHDIYDVFLDEASAEHIVAQHGKPDFITFTNVFAHIEDLRSVLSALRILIGPETVLVIENHYLGSVLDGGQFDTFYHEHPRTYSYTSFKYMADSLGVTLLDAEFPKRYGGNIRVFLGPVGDSLEESVVERERYEAEFLARFMEIGKDVVQWKQTKRAQLAALAEQHGALRAKAFPGRAAILVKLLELDETIISAVYEKPGSLKIGHYLPGTRIPIRSDNELFAMADQSKPIINFAWHIPAEIKTYLRDHGYGGDVVDILNAQDMTSSRA